jgi:hypothetical protein
MRGRRRRDSGRGDGRGDARRCSIHGCGLGQRRRNVRCAAANWGGEPSKDEVQEGEALDGGQIKERDVHRRLAAQHKWGQHKGAAGMDIAGSLAEGSRREQ